ncbi:MAG: hypothetical protein ACLQDL_16425 [Spirochaetia bacterium]
MISALAEQYNRFINALSFGAEYQKLRRLLNARIDSPASVDEIPPSHPAGFVREMRKRRITIVESYLIIIRYLESEHHRERIHALKLLEELTLHSKNITMPLNTARVQLALMKEAIKNRDNKRRQLELLHDFTVSSYGQPSVIRGLLDELGIIELPETGRRIADMDMGWDLHVHDNSSYGRKTPSQLVIDAFIKGISEITVAFNLLNSLDNIDEVLSAGNILGVRVAIGAEFSMLSQGHRFHFMFLLPRIRTSGELARFFEQHAAELKFFIDGLHCNQQSRIASIHALIDNFNTLHLPALNAGYEEGSIYALPALDLAAVDEIVPMESLNRMYLGELLYSRWKPVLLKRVLLAKSKLNHALADLRRGSISQWDYTNMASRSHTLRETYTQLNPETLRGQYFGAPQLSEYPTVFSDMEAVCAPLKRTGGSIKILHPLEHGLDAAYRMILANAQWIDFVEVYNMYDSINRSVDDILRFARFINTLNSGRADLVRPFLAGHDPSLSEAELSRIAASTGSSPLIPVCGSDSTGRSSMIPGMGFVFQSHIIGPHRRRFLERHFALPEFVSRVIAAQGSYVSPETESGPGDAIISMGKSTHFITNKIGDEHDVAPIPLGRALRYLNPVLLNFLCVGVGFLLTVVTIGWEYALVWFGITGLRHVIVDLVARRGSRVREWSLREIDYRNIARSLFWTGVSVPLLAFVKWQFDLLWPFATTGHLYQFSKFFCISFVNGLYLVMHNVLRGFEKGVTRANFFRNIISWPFASLFAPAGDVLLIPTIVQSKLWSDVVGGFIEGWGKFIRSVGLTRRDLSEIIPLSRAEEEPVRSTAILDLLYIFGRETRARNSMREIFFGKRNLLERLGDVLRGRKARPLRREEEYRDLAAWFDHVDNYHLLADFVIAHYSPEWALMLIDLMERQYLRFRDWLSHEKHTEHLLSQRPTLS